MKESRAASAYLENLLCSDRSSRRQNADRFPHKAAWAFDTVSRSGEIALAAGDAKHRFTNSHAQEASEPRPADPRASDRSRGRAADQGHKGQSLWPPRRHHGPYGLQAWPAGFRWEQVDLRTATLHVRRVKKGTPNTHLGTSCAPSDGSNANRSLVQQQRLAAAFR
jgi:hypothetical protein